MKFKSDSLVMSCVSIIPIAIVLLTVVQGCKSKTSSKVLVHADDFREATKAAIDIWNGYVGCDFLSLQGEGHNVPQAEILVRSDDGAPCGDPWRPEAEWGHDATAYKCGENSTEILVSRPGDIHTQACIIAHELGHALGRPHQSFGVMGKKCGNKIRVSDKDASFLNARHCK